MQAGGAWVAVGQHGLLRKHGWPAASRGVFFVAKLVKAWAKAGEVVCRRVGAQGLCGQGLTSLATGWFVVFEGSG